MWYLVVRSRGRVVAHRAARITGAEVLDAPFVRPEGFDLAAFWAGWTAEFENSFGRLPVTVTLTRAGLDTLPEVLGQPAAADPEADADGRYTLVLYFDSPSVARWRILGLGADAEVVEPDDIRADVAETARLTAARYPPAAGR